MSAYKAGFVSPINKGVGDSGLIHELTAQKIQGGLPGEHYHVSRSLLEALIDLTRYHYILEALTTPTFAPVTTNAGELIYTAHREFTGNVINDIVSPIVDVPPPPVGTDPYWAFVTAMSWLDLPAGTTPSMMVDGCGILYHAPTLDSFKSSVQWNGGLGNEQSPGGVISTASLPLFGRNTMMHQSRVNGSGSGAYIDNGAIIIIAGSGVCNKEGISGITGDFTFEQFYAMDSLGPNVSLSIGGGPGSPAAMVTFYIGQSGLQGNIPIFRIVKSIMPAGADYEVITPPNPPPLLTYFHFCVERVGKTLSVYLNGVLVGAATQDKVYPLGTTFWQRARYFGPYRLTQGIARYKGPFTPPTSVFPTN